MGTSRTRHDYFYFQVVLTNYRLYRNLAEDLEKMIEEGVIKDMSQELEGLETEAVSQEQVDEKLAKIQSAPFFQRIVALRNAGASAVVFSAMCLEALINEYGALNTSSSYFRKHLDSLDVRSKWVVIPQLVAGESFPTDGQAFELLSDLFSYRNKLVHPKGKEVLSIKGEEPSMVSEATTLAKQVPRCVVTIREVTKALWEIDDEFEYLNQYRPLWDEDYRENDSRTNMERMVHTIVSQLP